MGFGNTANRQLTHIEKVNQSTGDCLIIGGDQVKAIEKKH